MAASRVSQVLVSAIAAAMMFAIAQLLPSAMPQVDAPTRAPAGFRNLLWPGGFAHRDGRARSAPEFTARGGSYVAVVESSGLRASSGKSASHWAGVEFVGAAAGLEARMDDPSPGSRTVFARRGDQPVVSHETFYGETDFPEAYPGIDAHYHATDGRLELDFLVHPGGDPTRIALRGLDGSSMAREPATGDIVIARGDEKFRIKRPEAYQPANGLRIPVPVTTELTDGVLRFRLGPYDRDRELVIDPLVATYSTFIGTNSDAQYDAIYAMATDAAGNVYLGGTTQYDLQYPVEQVEHGFLATPSSLLIGTPGMQSNPCQFGCGYVLKLDPSQHVVYSAQIYGFEVHALAVGADGSAYLTGHTFDGGRVFPATPGVFSNNPGGQVFITRLAPDGSAMIYSALVTGDDGKGIAVDAGGNAYVVGAVSTPTLPTTPGALKPAYQATGNLINNEGFLLKVSADGTALAYGTYLGGSGADVANAVSVDASGNALVAGQTGSPDFTGFGATVSGPSDAFLVRLSADGSTITQGRLFGGGANDFATSLCSDHQGGWLLAGASESADFPVTPGVFQPVLLGQRNGWLARLDSTFNTVYATYYGGSAIDGVLAVAADAQANAYVAGVTFSSDEPATAAGFQDRSSSASSDLFAGLGGNEYAQPKQPNREAFLGVLSADGRQLSYGSILGGYYTNPRDYAPLSMATSVAVVGNGTVYVAGATSAASFPVADAGLRSGMGGNADAFLVRFDPQSLSVTTPTLLPEAQVSSAYSYQLAASGGTPPYAWQLAGFALPTGLALASSGQISGTVSSNQAEQEGYQFTVKVTDALGARAYKSLVITPVFAGNPLCTASGCTLSVQVGQQLVWPLPAMARAVKPINGVLGGALPAGITLDTANASLTGAATQAGTFAVSLVETDAANHTATFNITLVVGGGSSGGSGGGGGGGGGGASTSGSSSGGGGALDPAALLALLLALASRQATRARTRQVVARGGQRKAR